MERHKKGFVSLLLGPDRNLLNVQYLQEAEINHGPLREKAYHNEWRFHGVRARVPRTARHTVSRAYKMDRFVGMNSENRLVTARSWN
jgi:hypothetical protein